MVKIPFKTTILTGLFLLSCYIGSAQSKILGAWETMEDGQKIVSIVADKYFAVSFYTPDNFIGTFGGRWEEPSPNRMSLTIEFDTFDSTNVGTSSDLDFAVDGDRLTVGENKWTRIDDGHPGALHDAWLMTGRKRDGAGEIQTREIGPRKTMKILSGTRFQWIAYNTDTKQFFGTGGGTYTTVNGKYTENIEFFSRDNSRVGASLPFDYELVDNAWHHSGKSSKGDPMYEVWSRRSGLE